MSFLWKVFVFLRTEANILISCFTNPAGTTIIETKTGKVVRQIRPGEDE